MYIYIHPTTKLSLDGVLNNGTHAIILSGKVGVGLMTIAQDVAKQSGKVLHVVLPEKDEKIDIEKGTITVQSIRRLYDLTKTREPSGRIILIDYAERMGVPAQNAFLKLLEEPVEGTQFMLLTHQLSMLLPTIQSRSQAVMVRPVSNEQSQEMLDDLRVTDATKKAQLLFIANGLPAELYRLVSDETYFTNRAQIVKNAREFITGSLYGRLIIANKYKNDRPGALLLLEDASKMLQKSLAEGGAESNVKALQKLELLHKRVTEQGNIRLQLSTAVAL